MSAGRVGNLQQSIACFVRVIFVQQNWDNCYRQCFHDKIFSLLILLYLQRSLSCWHHTFHYVWLHLWLPSGLPLLKKAPHDGLYPDNQQPTTMTRILVSRSCNSFACMTCMTTWMNEQFPYLFLGPIKKLWIIAIILRLELTYCNMAIVDWALKLCCPQRAERAKANNVRLKVDNIPFWILSYPASYFGIGNLI